MLEASKLMVAQTAILSTMYVAQRQLHSEISSGNEAFQTWVIWNTPLVIFFEVGKLYLPKHVWVMKFYLLQFPISLSPFVHVVESHWHLQFTKSEAALVFTIDFPYTCPILEFCPMASWVTRPKIRRKIFILTLIDAWIEMCLQLVIYLCFYSSTKAVHWKHTGDWIICLVRSTAWFSKLVFRSPSYEWGASSYLILPWEHIRTHCKI